MNTLASHMNEALKIGKNLSKFSTYSCRPANKKELKQIIKERISKEGPNCNLNDIDTSLVTFMSQLFYKIDFTGDISNWNTSNVTDMRDMFHGCTNFNSDLSRWNTSKVENMSEMFCGCTNFNSDLSHWDVKKVNSMSGMFYSCGNFNCDLSDWEIRFIINLDCMFRHSGVKNKPEWYKKRFNTIKTFYEISPF